MITPEPAPDSVKIRTVTCLAISAISWLFCCRFKLGLLAVYTDFLSPLEFDLIGRFDDEIHRSEPVPNSPRKASVTGNNLTFALLRLKTFVNLLCPLIDNYLSF